MTSRACAPALFLAIFSVCAPTARGEVESNMATPGGSSATVTITMTITTSFGTSSDTEARTMTTSGTAHAAFAPDATPFTGAQFNTMQLSFADATYNFGFYCAPPFPCLVNFQPRDFHLLSEHSRDIVPDQVRCLARYLYPWYLR